MINTSRRMVPLIAVLFSMLIVLPASPAQPAMLFAGSDSVEVPLQWERSREADTLDGGSVGSRIDAGRQLPTYSEAVWNNGTYTAFVNRRVIPTGYRWASWPQQHGVDLRHFKATFTLPNNLDPATAIGILFDPFYEYDTVPINDNLYAYVNGVHKYSGGTNYNAANGGYDGTSALANETDGWYIQGGIQLNGFQAGLNVIDIVTEERAILGGMGYLSLRFGSRSPQPHGRITSPGDNSSVGPATIRLTAEASADPPATGIKQVAFHAFYDGSWHSAGLAVSAPYEIDWQIPNLLRSQQLKFAIDVTDNVGVTTKFAGGLLRLNFIVSLGDSSILENWIPSRAYLNQRSLPGGWEKCSAASMTMVLAMLGRIGREYNTMATKANEIFPKVLKDGIAYIYLMRAELGRQGITSVDKYNGIALDAMSTDNGWKVIKQEINAGRPVIVRTRHSVLTPAGHFIVAVGYREKATSSRELIAYDPNGKWKGKTCSELGSGCPNNYDLNTDDPASYKGLWVYYNFDTVFGDYLITAQPTQSLQSPVPMSIPSTLPDVTSDEPANIGTYAGAPIGGGQGSIFIPFIKR